VNAWNRENGLPEIGMGIAINAGDVVVGNIGSMKRAKYAAVGAQVNLTSRIQSHAAIGEIVVTESVLPAAAGKTEVVAQETVTPKGVRDPVAIFRIAEGPDRG
jgi:adenylate cyclase